jgi:hypothetical protein
MSSTIHNIYTQIINHKKKKNTYFKKEPKKEIDIKIKEHFTSQKNMLKVSIYNPITLDNILDNDLDLKYEMDNLIYPLKLDLEYIEKIKKEIKEEIQLNNAFALKQIQTELLIDNPVRYINYNSDFYNCDILTWNILKDIANNMSLENYDFGKLSQKGLETIKCFIWSLNLIDFYNINNTINYQFENITYIIPFLPSTLSQIPFKTYKILKSSHYFTIRHFLVNAIYNLVFINNIQVNSPFDLPFLLINSINWFDFAKSIQFQDMLRYYIANI